MFSPYVGDIKRGYNINLPDFKSVSNKSDFPGAVNNVITLADNTAYMIAGEIDLGGCRIVSGDTSVIYGLSPEYSILKSTGFNDSSGAFLTSEYTCVLSNVGFHDFNDEQVLDFDGSVNTIAIDWFGINFLNCSNVGVIDGASNFIANTFGFLNSAGMTFDGSIGTISFANTLFEGSSGDTCLTFPASLTITRRFRVIYSSFVVLSGETGISFNASVTVPDEGYILDTVNFAGGGTYLSGLDKSSEKALFSGCRGIENTAAHAGYYMAGNATTTSTTTAGTFYKIAGSTAASANNQKFTITDNRATYTGALTSSFSIFAACSADTINSRDYAFKIAINGTVQSAQSIIRGRSNINLECSVFDTVTLSTDDYIEIFVSNSTSGNTVLITDMSVIINRLN